MKQIFFLTTLLFSSILLTGTANAEITSAKPPSTAASQEAPAWLFVINAPRATLSAEGGKNFLTLHAVGDVRAFTKSPHRQVNVYTVSNFVNKIWTEGGATAFTQDHPNGAVTAILDTSHTQVASDESITLFHPVYDAKSDTLRFEVHNLDKGALVPTQGKTLDLQGVTLFVDNWINHQ